MTHKLERHIENFKYIYYFNSKQLLEIAKQAKQANQQCALADYVIRINKGPLIPTGELVKCRSPGGLEGIMDMLVAGK